MNKFMRVVFFFFRFFFHDAALLFSFIHPTRSFASNAMYSTVKPAIKDWTGPLYKEKYLHKVKAAAVDLYKSLKCIFQEIHKTRRDETRVESPCFIYEHLSCPVSRTLRAVEHASLRVTPEFSLEVTQLFRSATDNLILAIFLHQYEGYQRVKINFIFSAVTIKIRKSRV